MNTLPLLTLFFSLLFSSLTLAESHPPKDPNHAWKLIQQGALVIDVRTQGEFQQGHIEGAKLIPYDVIVQGAKMFGIKKETPIVVYCRSGRRSGAAWQALTQAGYSQVYNGGGFELLKQAQP